MEETMSNFDDVRNKCERAAEQRFPGYKGPRWGEVTERGKTNERPDRTQVSFEDGTVYWLDVPASSILPGDMVAIAESEKLRKVRFAGITLDGDYFITKNPIPHRFGTFVELHRGK